MYAHSHAACRPTLDTGIRSRRRPVGCTLSALEFFFIHCPNGRLGQDLGFGGFVSAVKLPELLNTNLPTVRANIVSLYCKDKDLTPKDQDKDKDLKNVLKESLRTRTRRKINIPVFYPTKALFLPYFLPYLTILTFHYANTVFNNTPPPGHSPFS